MHQFEPLSARETGDLFRLACEWAASPGQSPVTPQTAVNVLNIAGVYRSEVPGAALEDAARETIHFLHDGIRRFVEGPLTSEEQYFN